MHFVCVRTCRCCETTMLFFIRPVHYPVPQLIIQSSSSLSSLPAHYPASQLIGHMPSDKCALFLETLCSVCNIVTNFSVHIYNAVLYGPLLLCSSVISCSVPFSVIQLLFQLFSSFFSFSWVPCQTTKQQHSIRQNACSDLYRKTLTNVAWVVQQTCFAQMRRPRFAFMSDLKTQTLNTWSPK
jgi:hypothetical protein